jgi:acyl-CoA synthetase (AMP-forming)/AMP-acid ligase II
LVFNGILCKFIVLFQLNGSTGERITYRQILSRIVPLSRVLQGRYANGTRVMFLLRNNHLMAAIYYATLFSSVLPLILDTESTLRMLFMFVFLCYIVLTSSMV